MLKSLKSIVQQVSAAPDMKAALDIIVHRVQDAMSVSVCSVYLYDPAIDKYTLKATKGLNPSAINRVSLGRDEGLVGLVASREEILNLKEAEKHPHFRYLPETGEEKYHSFLGVPIIHHRKVSGILVVQQISSRRFDESDEAFLITLSAQLAGVVALAESMGELSDTEGLDQTEHAPREVEFHGIASAQGVAIGKALVVSPVADLFSVSADAATVEQEIALFEIAVNLTREEIRSLELTLRDHVSEQERMLFTAYVQMLDDQSLHKEVLDHIDAGESAEAAWSEVILGHCRTFEQMDDSYLRERASDLRDLGRRVLGHMQNEHVEKHEYPDEIILVAEELTASMLGEVPREKLLGLVSINGTFNSHIAILARAMGIPAVLGVESLRIASLRGKELIVDGYHGSVFVNPTAQHLEHFAEVLREDRALLLELEKVRDLPSESIDGRTIKLLVNTGLVADVRISLDRGAEGVGLYRSEVPFFSQDRFPSEEEQRQLYKAQLDAFAPRPVVMRTLDIGGDKALSYFPIEESNPFLGWRGIRITLDHPEIFLSQVRAMLKASIESKNLSILLPMVSSVSEVESALELIYRAHDELTEEEQFDIPMPPIGAMIEVPSAVFLAREIAKRVDFISVGSNDLTQYILAVDRNNARVADLYDAMHPSVLYALNHIARCAHSEGKLVGVCGELAGDPFGALMLMSMGYDSLSMNAASLLKIKSVIRETNIRDFRPIMREALAMPDAASVRRLLRDSACNQGFLKKLIDK